jgi:hypothetical protein
MWRCCSRKGCGISEWRRVARCGADVHLYYSLWKESGDLLTKLKKLASASGGDTLIPHRQRVKPTCSSGRRTTNPRGAARRLRVERHAREGDWARRTTRWWDQITSPLKFI